MTLHRRCLANGVGHPCFDQLVTASRARVRGLSSKFDRQSTERRRPELLRPALERLFHGVFGRLARVRARTVGESQSERFSERLARACARTGGEIR